MDYENIIEMLTVSGSDNLDSETLTFESVSGNGESAFTNYYIINMLQNDMAETQEEIAYTLFNKPLDEYTVSEGLLAIIAALAVVAVIWYIVKGGFSWHSW